MTKKLDTDVFDDEEMSKPRTAQELADLVRRKKKGTLMKKTAADPFLLGFSVQMEKIAEMEKTAPFKSQAQRRKFYAMASRGEISKSTVKKWEEHTPKDKKLPERLHKAAMFLQMDLLKKFGRGEITMDQLNAEHDRRARMAKAAADGVSCPVCGGMYVTRCRCRIGDSKCASGHEWHYEGGKPVIGPSSHATKTAEEAEA